MRRGRRRKETSTQQQDGNVIFTKGAMENENRTDKLNTDGKQKEITGRIVDIFSKTDCLTCEVFLNGNSFNPSVNIPIPMERLLKANKFTIKKRS